MSKVSVIMPIYNAEKYLKQAIESVLNQTYGNFELILINDASTDKSKEICREYCKMDSRIVLLENNSENHGPGPTRNIGLDYALGEYIYFMDADDWIEDCLLQYAVNRMQETNADIVQFGAIYEWKEGNRSEPYGVMWNGVLTKDEIKRDILAFWKTNKSSLWICLFRRETVKTIRFENIMYGEDASYIVDALCNTVKIAYIEKALYHYRYVDGSTSRRWRNNTIDCFLTNWKHQRNYFDSFQGEIDIMAYAVVAYSNIIWTIYYLSNTSCPISYREKIRELARLEKEMDFDKYRQAYPLELKHGVEKLKYMFIKYRLERIMLFFGPLFLRIVRGE
ncbi:MAG: glycosyltransferase [Eubacterium sp.]|nr:glycosyltransferase [Eubacterium sp.]